jgi:hypothetical protein
MLLPGVLLGPDLGIEFGEASIAGLLLVADDLKRDHLR